MGRTEEWRSRATSVRSLALVWPISLTMGRLHNMDSKDILFYSSRRITKIEKQSEERVDL